MVADNGKIKVAFDVKRLVDAARSRSPHMGITRYASVLFQKISNDRVSLSPVVYPNLRGIETVFDEVEKLLGTEVPRGWKERRQWLRLLSLVETFQKKSAGVPIIKKLVEPCHRRLCRYAVVRATLPTALKSDIYHSPVNPLPPQRWTGSATRILTVHDCIYLKHPEFYPGKGVPAIKKALGSINTSRDYVICDSESTRYDLMGFIPIEKERTCVIPLAAEEVFCSPEELLAAEILRSEGLSHEGYILALGQAEKRKNILGLVKAFSAIREKEEFRKFQLVLVTGEKNRLALIKEIENAGISMPRIKILTDVDDRHLSALYSSAALFAYVPLYEGFGIPPLEAMAAGCPVVVADNSSIPEVVGDAGIYVDAGDLASIRAGLEKTLGDRGLRERLKELGKRRASMFTWESTAKMTVDFYQSAIEHSRSRKR